jgi:flavorubredoxin
MITNDHSGTNVEEVADGIFRINTPVDIPGGAFSFNQYLLVDEEPLLFHTGPRRLFPLVREAVDRIIPASQLRWVSFSHVEADECGSLNEWLAIAPSAQPLCGSIAALVSIHDMADRAPRGLADGETVSLGARTVRWFDAPHLPHGWECGYLGEESTRTLFCGDLLTQPGRGEVGMTEGDVLGPSEAFRQHLDYFSHSTNTQPLIEKLAAFEPQTLACMHGSAWRGDGGTLLRQLGSSLIG